MPKKLLFSVLIPALFATAVNAQEKNVEQGAESSFQTTAVTAEQAVDNPSFLKTSVGTDAPADKYTGQEANTKSQEQATDNSQSQGENVILWLIKAAGRAYASGKVVDTDELAEDWQSAQNPDVEAKTQKMDNSQPKGENVILRFIKAVGRAYASGKVVEIDELAEMDGTPAQEQKPAAEVSAAPAPSENITVPSAELLEEKASSMSSATAESLPTAQQRASSEPQSKADIQQTGTRVSGKVTEPAIAGQNRLAKDHAKALPSQQIAVQSETGHVFPEIMASTWQDQLPKKITVSEMTEKALAGDPEAQYRLGMACYYGKVVQKDDGKAFQWWQQSAKKGYPKAMHIMGVAYRRGIGVPKHAEKALDWFTKAAQQGRAIDQYIVADVYYEAKVNNVRDDALAIYWATHAARQGHPGALVLLAQAKLEGRGMPPNIIHAYVLAVKAAEFDREAYAVVDEIEKSLSDEQQEIAKTVMLEDALKPIPLASLLVQSTSTEKTVQPSAEDTDQSAVGHPKTDHPIGRTDND